MTLSTTEAEYVAASACVCQAFWFRHILKELGYEVEASTTILCDNTSVIQLSRNLVFYGKCKHIDLRFQFLREMVNNRVIKLKQCGTQEQTAYILTKPLKREAFEDMKNRLRVCSVGSKLNSLYEA